MCGRASITKTEKQIADHFGVLFQTDEEDRYAVAPNYNVAPTHFTPVIASDDPTILAIQRWGISPPWAQGKGQVVINARKETVLEKRMFKKAIEERRCIVPMDGFYEWQKTPAGKQPFYFHLGDRSLFAFAGLWERWRSPDGEVITSCTILTTSANELIRPIHERMPVILSPADYELWLDPDIANADQLQALLRPYPASSMASYAVSPRVNKPQADDPSCLAPLNSI